MTPGKGDNPEHGQPPIEHLVDAYFDGALDGDARRSLEQATQSNSAVRGDLTGIAFAVSCLSAEPRARDLTGAILTRVEQERPFVPEPARRKAVAARAAVAVLALAMVGAVVLAHRTWPGALAVRSRPEPLSAVVAAGAIDVRAGLDNLRRAFEPVRVPFALGSPVIERRPSQPSGENLSLRDVVRYQPPVEPSYGGRFNPRPSQADSLRRTHEGLLPPAPQRPAPWPVMLHPIKAGD